MKFSKTAIIYKLYVVLFTKCVMQGSFFQLKHQYLHQSLDNQSEIK